MADNFGRNNDAGGVLVANPVTGEDYYKNALAYEVGKGRVRKNPHEAFRNFQKAASLHHVEACFRVGEYLMQGKIRKADMKAAVPYFREAADGGHLKATERMMKCAASGSGMTKDVAEAMRWAEAAKKLGSEKAEEFIAAEFKKTQTIAPRQIGREDGEETVQSSASKISDTGREIVDTIEGVGSSVPVKGIAEQIRGYFDGNVDAARHISEYMAFLAKGTEGETSARYSDLAGKFRSDAEPVP